MARILVVEHQEQHRDSLRRGREAEGSEVVTASRGDEGFGAVTTRPIDAIVLDIMLLGRHGPAVLLDLRAGGFASRCRSLRRSTRWKSGPRAWTAA